MSHLESVNQFKKIQNFAKFLKMFVGYINNNNK